MPHQFERNTLLNTETFELILKYSKLDQYPCHIELFTSLKCTCGTFKFLWNSLLLTLQEESCHLTKISLERLRRRSVHFLLRATNIPHTHHRFASIYPGQPHYLFSCLSSHLDCNSCVLASPSLNSFQWFNLHVFRGWQYIPFNISWVCLWIWFSSKYKGDTKGIKTLAQLWVAWRIYPSDKSSLKFLIMIIFYCIPISEFII